MLSSGYDGIDPVSGTETKDADETLTFTLDAHCGFATVAGWSGKNWDAVPGVVATQ